MNYNRTIIGGRLTRDPELRYTAKGTPVCQFSIATGRKWKDEAGQEREETTFVETVAWTRRAEVINQYFKKGDPILVEGYLRTESWEDKATGKQRSKLVLVMEQFQFCGGRKPDADGPAAGPAPRQPGATDPPAATAKATTAAKAKPDVDTFDPDDNVPF